MCEPGNHYYEGTSCGARLDQLRRLVWVLMVWVSILSLGLGASITLHIFHLQDRETPNPENNTSITQPIPSFTSYSFDQNTPDMILKWRKANGDAGDTAIKIEKDGNYFLFFRVTLNSLNKGVNYTVTVEKKPDGNNSTKITEEHINGTENSTGFMGIGVSLTENTVLNVICNPHAVFNVHNTYLGLIHFGNQD